MPAHDSNLGMRQDVVSFQEPVDPLIEKLQEAIDEFRSRADTREFKTTLEKIHQLFPFIDLAEFVELHVGGESDKEMIRRFNLSGHTDRKRVLQVLKLGSRRKSSQRGARAKALNLTDPKMAGRYAYLKSKLNTCKKYVYDKVTFNTLRMIITLQLYRNDGFLDAQELAGSVRDTIDQFDHVLPEHSKELLRLKNGRLAEMTESVLQEMREESLLEVNRTGRVRLESQQMRLPHYVLGIIRKHTGITYEKLAEKVKENLPAMMYMPQALLLATLEDLISGYEIVRKEGYWKRRPYYDEYFTFDDYKQMVSAQSTSKTRKFFGRRIDPNKFIGEIMALEKGDFEDQDDQVTRIAGMILSRSNMMRHPPNDLQEFDFAVDLSAYEFTNKEQEIIKSLGLVMRSNTVYVKVMISEKITTKTLKTLSSILRGRGRGEQGFVISFSHYDKNARSLLERDKTIQLITEQGITEWCKTTPVIPTRRGAVAVVRRGDHKGDIVKVESVNYESGLADIMLFPDMIAKTQYIGSLEEITLQAGIEKFVDYSSKYFRFLAKLWQISATEKFRSIVADDTASFPDAQSPAIRLSANSIGGNFGKRSRVSIDLSSSPDTRSLGYSTDGLFSCTCLGWKHRSRTEGLCPHIIFTLNTAIKKILSSDDTAPDEKIENILSKIEVQMDVFLDRLRYSSNGSGAVRCPSCGAAASTLDEAKSLFGYRQMHKSKKFSLRCQSRCKKCRR